jgi:hypothetical protein
LRKMRVKRHDDVIDEERAELFGPLDCWQQA